MPERGPARRRAAAALRYGGGDAAPRVVASGRGEVAERILEAARESGVPVREDELLAEALAALELDTEVPPALYQAVAEALVWAYRLTQGRSPQTAAAKESPDRDDNPPVAVPAAPLGLAPSSAPLRDRSSHRTPPAS